MLRKSTPQKKKHHTTEQLTKKCIGCGKSIQAKSIHGMVWLKFCENCAHEETLKRARADSARRRKEGKVLTKNGICLSCKREIKLSAKGLCQACYNLILYQDKTKPKVKCPYCGREFVCLSEKHILLFHGKSVSQFRQEFPGFKMTVDPNHGFRKLRNQLGESEFRKLRSEQNRGKYTLAKQKHMQTLWLQNKGSRHKVEHIEKIQATTKKFWEEHPERRVEYSARVEGAGNPAYVHGQSREPYPLLFNRRFKRIIREKFNHTCQLCGVPERELRGKQKVLCPHHINYIKKDIRIENFSLLCHECNKKVNWDRKKWFHFFCRLHCVDPATLDQNIKFT